MAGCPACRAGDGTGQAQWTFVVPTPAWAQTQASRCCCGRDRARSKPACVFPGLCLQGLWGLFELSSTGRGDPPGMQALSTLPNGGACWSCPALPCPAPSCPVFSVGSCRAFPISPCTQAPLPSPSLGTGQHTWGATPGVSYLLLPCPLVLPADRSWRPGSTVSQGHNLVGPSRYTRLVHT